MLTPLINASSVESKEVPNHQGIMLPPDSPSSSTVRRLRNEVEELKTQVIL